jgi:Tfp pilus assembly protein PilE
MLATLLARLLPYKATAILAVLAALALTIFVQAVRLDAAQASLASKTETVDTLNKLMAAQNAGIHALKEEAVRREALSAKAVASAKKLQERARARVASIEAAPVPQDCQGAMQWLVTEGAKLEGQL